MLKLHLILLLSFKVINILSAGPETEGVASGEDISDASFDILPLTLIQSSSILVDPTTIKNIKWVNNGQNLGVSTQFINSHYPGNQIFLCPANIPPHQIALVSSWYDPLIDFHYQYCNYPITFQESEALRCTQQPKYLIEKILAETSSGVEEVPCDRNPNGRMFRFVYNLCVTEASIQNGVTVDMEALIKTIKYNAKYEVFRFCYDSQLQALLSTQHRIRSARLLINDALKNEQDMSYQLMIDATNRFHRDEFALKELHDKYSEPSSTEIPIDQPESRNNKRYILQKLVPPEDFAFALWKKPTYDFLNSKLMRSDLVDIWNHISALIRKDAIKKNREYDIHTCTFRRPHHTNLSNVHVPEIWTKNVFFYDEQSLRPDGISKCKAISINMYQFFDDDSISDPLDGNCVNLCENFFTTLFPIIGKSIRCCSLINNDVLSRDMKVDEDIEIDFLDENSVTEVVAVSSEESDEDMADASLHILPLTMILSNIGCVTPTKIDNVGFLNHNQSLSGYTKFSNFRYQGQQVFFCAADTITHSTSMASTSQTPQIPIDYQYCNYPVKFHYSDILRCAQEPKYLIEQIFIKTESGMQEVPCVETTSGRMFRFIYKLCITTNPIKNRRVVDTAKIIKTLKYQTKFEAFRFCYDPLTRTLLRTEHRIRSTRLLGEEALQNERDMSYELMLDAGNFFNRDWFALKELYDKLSNDTPTDTSTDHQENMQVDTSKDHPESSSSTSTTKHSYTLQKLVPPEDFAFALWKKPAYDFLNHKFMRSDLVDLWNHISALIRANAIQENREYLIQTGAYRRPAEANPSKIHIPEIWMKKIFFQYYQPQKPHETAKYKGMAIVMNQYFDDDSVSDPLGRPCFNLCGGFFRRRFPNVGHSIRCCSLLDTDAAPNRITVDKDLEIAFLLS